jgi:formylglycine-generating enzyme required for sulfatase activity
MWSRINIGQNWRNGSCHGNAINTSWDDAKKLCQKFDLAGFKDWRLPTKDELKKLASMSKMES